MGLDMHLGMAICLDMCRTRKYLDMGLCMAMAFCLGMSMGMGLGFGLSISQNNIISIHKL